MKNYHFLFVFILVFFMFIQLVPCEPCFAYWIWTPEIGKWINPKYSVKPTPKEQFDWAFNLYQEKEYSKAAGEFDKLVFNYPNSKYAPSALYYRGICLEKMNYYYEAYCSYDKILRMYPTFENIREIIKREFNIGEGFLGGEKRKIMGMKMFPSLECAIEIFESIAENAPFSEYGVKSQFNVGVALKKDKKYMQAKEAFEKVILNYPDSETVEKAKFEIADCSFQASQQPEYEQTATRQAIDEFSQLLKDETQDKSLTQEVQKRLLTLQEKDAEHLYHIARFYERIRKYEAAGIYYKEIIDKYPQTSFAAKAEKQLKLLQEKKK